MLRQDLSQPGGQLGLAVPAEAFQALIGLQQCLLHHVGGVELPVQTRVQVELSQQAQVGPKPFQRLTGNTGFAVHE